MPTVLPRVEWRRLTALKHCVKGRAEFGELLFFICLGFYGKVLSSDSSCSFLAARNYFDSQPNREHITCGDEEL